jgi:outer membrane protein OmpA-like peptidoglycan-associated protein
MRTDLAKKTMCLAIALGFTGCATAPGQNPALDNISSLFNSDDPCSNNSRNLGILIGIVGGGVLAKATDQNGGAVIAAAAVGGLFGGLIGADMDRRRCELSKVAKQYNLDLSVATISGDGKVLDDAAMKAEKNAEEVKKTAIGSVVSVRDQAEAGGHFEPNSDVLTPRARQYFAAISESYNAKKAAEQYASPQERQEYLRLAEQRKLVMIGHTDDTGSSKFNADLSERRAKAVAHYLERQGIPREAIFYQGAGEVYPIADNNTEVGRMQNRRVELIELTNDANLQKFLAARVPRYEFYRPQAVAAAKPPAAAVTPTAKQEATKRPAKSTPARSPAVAKATPQSRDSQTIVAAGTAASGKTTVKPGSARTPNVVTAPDRVQVRSKSDEIDFGGIQLTSTMAAANIGKIETKKPWFALISSAYADEPPVLADCSQDRPRASGAVRALKDGKVYKTSEHIPGLYGKTWADKVNGHQIVINKVAVLANEATLAQLPQLKVYTNYNPSVNRNPMPNVAITPEVNTYVGSNGILYRIFTNGRSGMQCADILFNRGGGATAKAGKLVYSQGAKLYVADFKPSLVY